MKRVFDIILAVLLAIPALLITMLACLAIVFETRASPLFLQERVGFGKRTFRMLKLRTMSADTQTVGSHEVPAGSITRVGAFLRKTKIDELPQILSVLAGDMSFVGPRPCLPSQTEVVAARLQRGVYNVRPGITGRAQLLGIDMSTPEQLATVDEEYVKSRTFAGDIAIVCSTALGKGSGDAARSS